MSRVTPPATKFTHALRQISSKAGRPSTLLNSQVRKSTCVPRTVSESTFEPIQSLESHDIRSHSTLGGHRPTPTAMNPIPLMQGFKTSSPSHASRDTSSIDYFFMPEMPSLAAEMPLAKLRVPLLPDNMSTSHGPEVLEAALPAQEISIVAAHPEQVLPAAMSEVVGNDGLDVDLGQLTAVSTGAPEKREKTPGVFRELWSGIVEDVWGSKHNSGSLKITY